MTSYIEVSFLNNVLIMMLSELLAHYLLLTQMQRRKMICYALTISLTGILFWGSHAIWIMLGIELICCIVWFRLHIKVYLLTCSLRLLISGTCYVAYGGSFHLLIYFVPAQSYTILYFWIIGGFFLIACMRKWKYFITQAQYVYEITLWAKTKKLRMYGYLDSGNLLTYQEIPIIFAISKYYEYFKNENIELVVMNTLKQTSSIRVYPCELQIKGYARQPVYICFERQSNLPMHCECLLNLHVLTR